MKNIFIAFGKAVFGAAKIVLAIIGGFVLLDAVTAYPPSEASAEGGSMRGAKTLLGAWLCRRLDDGTVMRRRITETEAYCGEEDTACHAHKNFTASPRIGIAYASPHDQKRK